MSEDREQLRTATAARDYFMRAWITGVKKHGRSWLTEDEAESLMHGSLRWASNEMDDLPLTAELTDHCMHWVVVLRVPSLHGTEYYEQELAVNYLPITDIQMSAVQEFFKALVGGITSQISEPYTPAYLKKVYDILEEVQSECEGCVRCYSITGIKHLSSGFEFHFSGKLGGDEEKIHAAFVVERVCSG